MMRIRNDFFCLKIPSQGGVFITLEMPLNSREILQILKFFLFRNHDQKRFWKKLGNKIYSP